MPESAVDQSARDLAHESLRRIDIHQAECEQLRETMTVKLDNIGITLSRFRADFAEDVKSLQESFRHELITVHSRIDDINKKLWTGLAGLVALLLTVVGTLLSRHIGI